MSTFSGPRHERTPGRQSAKTRKAERKQEAAKRAADPAEQLLTEIFEGDPSGTDDLFEPEEKKSK